MLIPAIDLHRGQCVQLQRGKLESARIYSHNAFNLASHWVNLGAERLHVVDLDGAFMGSSQNIESVEQIVAAADGVPVQLGGGIRTRDAIEFWLARGITQVILGTQAILDPTFLGSVATRYSKQIILGLDVRDGVASIRGWQDDSHADVQDVLHNVASLPLFSIVFTDVKRDGMLTGANIQSIQDFLVQTEIDVIASGGIRNTDDLRQLRVLSDSHPNLVGAISGSALYEKQIDFADGLAICR